MVGPYLEGALYLSRRSVAAVTGADRSTTQWKRASLRRSSGVGSFGDAAVSEDDDAGKLQ